jgi:hypothetical protein
MYPCTVCACAYTPHVVFTGTPADASIRCAILWNRHTHTHTHTHTHIVSDGLLYRAHTRPDSLPHAPPDPARQRASERARPPEDARASPREAIYHPFLGILRRSLELWRSCLTSPNPLRGATALAVLKAFSLSLASVALGSLGPSRGVRTCFHDESHAGVNVLTLTYCSGPVGLCYNGRTVRTVM